MKKDYRDGIDFIVVIFYRYGYAQIVNESIKKYVKDIPYTVNIINNGINEGEESGYNILKDMFKDDPNVIIHKGMEQGIDSNKNNPNTYICKYDNRGVSLGSYAKALSMNKAIRHSNRKYLCYLDADSIFLNEWVNEIIPMLEDNVFVSHNWRDDIDMQPSQFCVVKRETIENNYLYERGDIYPNIYYKDTGGMLSLWAKKNKKPFVILKNSYQDKSLKNQHVLNLSNGEQSWLDNKPIFYHYGHGSTRTDDMYLNWVRTTTEYLNIKFEDIVL